VSGIHVKVLLFGVLARLFVLENLGRIDYFARAYVQHVRDSIMRVLCGELRTLLEGGDIDGWGLLR